LIEDRAKAKAHLELIIVVYSSNGLLLGFTVRVFCWKIEKKSKNNSSIVIKDDV